MTQLCEHLERRGEVEALAWARSQPMGNGVQLARRITRQIRALGQGLAQQAMRVLIGPAVPWAVQIGNEHLDGEPLSQTFVLGHRVAPIIRQGFAQRRGHRLQFFREARSGTRRIRPVHPGQDDQACRPLHQGADGRTIPSPRDEVAFPVAGDGAVGHLRGAVGNQRHVEELPPSIHATRSRAARVACRTQGGPQLGAQGATWPHYNAP